ncbi:MAG TPA: PspC domain-containing protein [Propionibacteriaceae bacterium]
MNAPYAPRTPKKLERSRSNKMLGGVCGGFADYVNMDPTLVRVLTVILTLFTGVPVLVYLVALFIVPEESSTTPTGYAYPPVQAPKGYQAGATDRDDAVWGTEGAPWEQPTTAQPAARQTPEPQDPKPGF